MADLSFGPLKFALSAIIACLLLSTRQYTELIFLLDLMVQEDPHASHSFLHEKNLHQDCILDLLQLLFHIWFVH